MLPEHMASGPVDMQHGSAEALEVPQSTSQALPALEALDKFSDHEDEEEAEGKREDDSCTAEAFEVPGSASTSSKRTPESTSQVLPALEALKQAYVYNIGSQIAAASGATEHAASPPHQGVPILLDVHGLAQKPVSVKLIGAACGERYCHAGVGNVDNGWAIPAYKFTMQDLIGKKLVSLEKRDGMEGYHIKRDSEGVVLSEGKVSGFVGRNGDARAFGALAEVADDSQMVQVMFSTVPIKEKWENVAAANLDEVKTPVTPRSDASM